ncbi:MAG TPA: hypothetical protein EYP63_06025 [Desulfotomaculum sp.]|nr:hypothetical protein [Desulfotomaculum sp.]
MSEAEFSSFYPQITYKIPESDKYARFDRGKLVTQDEQVISYLREHQDFGSTLHEVTRSRPSVTVNALFCPFPGCDRVFNNERSLRAHMMRVHKSLQPEYSEEAQEEIQEE